MFCGAAKGDITPKDNLFPMPLFGALKINHINDRIYARALAFDNGEEKAVIISLDMTIVPFSSKTISFIAKECGLKEENILLCATHTHEVTPLGLPNIFLDAPSERKKVRKVV